MSVPYDDAARDVMIAFAAAQAEQVRADLIDAIENVAKASPDVKAELEEWCQDADTRDFVIAAFNGYAAGFMRGYSHAREDTS